MIRSLWVLISLLTSTAVWADSFTLQLPSNLSIDTIRREYPSLKVRSLFSEAEQKQLQKFKRQSLAKTYLVGPVASSEAQAFADAFLLRYPQAKLEKNEAIPFSQASNDKPDPLASIQWALKNTAQEVRIDLDDLHLATQHGGR